MDTFQDRSATDPAATMWGLPGERYDLVSFAIGDALAHGAQRLAAEPDEAVLDIATGTGWTARNVARFGATVSACDFSPGMIAAAERLSAHLDPPITFRTARAEALPYPDAAFDRAISTFGVMFAADHGRAAAELARVCRPGGRVVVVSWVPGGAVAEFFGLLGAHDPAPRPAGPSPLDWGDPAKLRALLGDAFDLDFERGTNDAYHESEQAIWDWYAGAFGPVVALLEQLDAPGRAALRRDVDAYHAHYRTESGRLDVARDYLLAIGTRR